MKAKQPKRYHESDRPARPMGTEFDDRTPAPARRVTQLRQEAVRLAERIDREDFQVNAEHDCKLAEPCSRAYDPTPDVQVDETFYAGTAIGALYGLAGSEHHLWQLAGWTLRGCELLPDE